MNASWNTIPAAQQAQILQALGLESLPELSALSEVQRTILAGILGTEIAEELVTQAPPMSTLTSPQLPEPAVSRDWSSLMMLVAEIRLKVDEQQLKTSTEAIKNTRAENKQVNKDHMDKLMKNLDELHKANQVSLASKILGWLGVIAGLILAVASIVSVAMTAGASLLLIGPIVGAVAASLAFGVQLAQELEVWDSFIDKIVTWVVSKGSDLSEDEIRFIVEMTINAIMLVLSIGSGIGAGAAVSKAMAKNLSKIKDGLAKAFDVAVDTISDVTAMAHMPGKLKTMACISLWTTLISSLVSVGGGGVSAYASVHQHRAAQAQADAKELNAWIARLSQQLQEEMEALEKIIQLMNNGLVDISDMMSGMSQSHQRMISHI